MNQGVYPLTASMVNQINRLDQISNNLANADTFGLNKRELLKLHLTGIYKECKRNSKIHLLNQ